MLMDSVNLVEGSVNSNIVMPNVTVAGLAAITAPNAGEVVYVLDGSTPGLYAYNGSAWAAVDSAVDLSAYVPTSQKGAANGVAPLNGSGLVDSAYLPSYVDDVIEAANLVAIQALTGETGKIYVALDTGLVYRWSGSAFVEISPSTLPTASQVTFTPAGNLAATNVSAALIELDTEKAALRSIPMSTKTGAYTLVVGDAGSQINTNSGVTVPASVFSAADVISIYNNSASAITVTLNGALTTYKNGSTTAVGASFSLPARSIVSIQFITQTELFVTGL